MRRTLFAAARTAIGVPVFFLFTLLLAVYIILMALSAPHRPYMERIIRWWSRRFLSVAPLKLTVTGLDRIDPSKQYVFVSNHLSNFDIPVMFTGLSTHRIRFLAKKEVFKIPLVATAMRRVGIVEVDRSGGSTVHAAINAAVAQSRKHGYSLIIFPEGTRSRDGELHGLKKGAFRIAIANNLDIVPVTVHGTWESWPPGSKLFYPGTARLVVHTPISVKNLDLSHIGEVRDQAHKVIEKTWNDLKSTSP